MLDIKKIYEEKLGASFHEYKMPAPSFSIMQAEIIEYDESKASLTIQMPVLEIFLNPFGTMQGGMIVAAMDNAIGSLSMLVAPLNMTRNIESKLIKAITMDVESLFITAKLSEQKKRRLIFDVVVKDGNNEVYATAKITNWIL
jgi:acyl-coenzyme A thioesterase PaaI-like protein